MLFIIKNRKRKIFMQCSMIKNINTSNFFIKMYMYNQEFKDT